MQTPVRVTQRQHGRRRVWTWAAATLAIGLAGAAGSALAQPARSGDRPADTRNTEDWGYRTGGRVGGGYNNGDYPTGEMHEAVDANARTTFARNQYHRLQDSLNSAIRLKQYNFERSPELTDALKQEQQAWQDYVSARNAALRSVVDDSTYQANISLKNEMGERIAETRAEFQDTRLPTDRKAAAAVDRARMHELITMAMVKLDYAQVATDMEVTALKSDSKVTEARRRLMDAGGRVQALRNDFDLKLRNDQELASLRGKIEDARIAFITAETYRNGAVEAANQALDYAYYKNRYNGYYPAGYTGYYPGVGLGVGVTPVMRD